MGQGEGWTVLEVAELALDPSHVQDHHWSLSWRAGMNWPLSAQEPPPNLRVHRYQ